MKWSTSAPANLMIMGEHSVVYGHKAIATAIDKRLYIEWETRNDEQIIIDSELAQYKTSLNSLSPHPQLQWIIATLNYFKNDLEHGFNIKVKSEFSSTLGLGSSAAVLTAMLGGLQFYLKKEASVIENFKIGLKIIHKIQKRGSGTDLMASLTGGMILFDPKEQQVEIIKNHTLSLNLIYSGYKVPTAEVLKQVQQQWQQLPELLFSLYQLMGETTEQAFNALQKNDLNSFYLLINSYQGLMDSLGVNDLMLSQIIYHTRNMPKVLASKISGSGLGDCVLTLGELDNNSNFIQALQPMSVQTSTQGLMVNT